MNALSWDLDLASDLDASGVCCALTHAFLLLAVCVPY